MKTYISHKRVQAAEIIKTEGNATNSGRLYTLDDGTVLEIAFGDKMVARYDPVVGDFLVQYEDGYKSFSPRRAFLDGYKPEGQSFSDIKRGLRVPNIQAGTNTGDGIALTSASHPETNDGKADPDPS